MKLFDEVFPSLQSIAKREEERKVPCSSAEGNERNRQVHFDKTKLKNLDQTKIHAIFVEVL